MWYLEGFFFINMVIKVAKQSNLWFLGTNSIYQWRDTGYTLHWKKVDVIRRLMLFISYSVSVCHTSFNSINVILSWIDDSLAGEVKNLAQLNSSLQLWFCLVLSYSKTRLLWQLGTPAPKYKRSQNYTRETWGVVAELASKFFSVLCDLNSKVWRGQSGSQLKFCLDVGRDPCWSSFFLMQGNR